MQLSRDSLDLVLRSQGHKIPHIAKLKLVEDWNSADQSLALFGEETHAMPSQQLMPVPLNTTFLNLDAILAGTIHGLPAPNCDLISYGAGSLKPEKREGIGAFLPDSMKSNLVGDMNSTSI